MPGPENTKKEEIYHTAKSQTERHVATIAKAVDLQEAKVKAGLPGPLQKSAEEGVEAGKALMGSVQGVISKIDAAAAALNAKNAPAPKAESPKTADTSTITNGPK